MGKSEANIIRYSLSVTTRYKVQAARYREGGLAEQYLLPVVPGVLYPVPNADALNVLYDFYDLNEMRYAMWDMRYDFPCLACLARLACLAGESYQL
jgi:hypothetical protein